MMNFCFSRGSSLTCSNFLCSCEVGPGLAFAAFGSLPKSSATVTSRAAAARSMNSGAGLGEQHKNNKLKFEVVQDLQ